MTLSSRDSGWFCVGCKTNGRLFSADAAVLLCRSDWTTSDDHDCFKKSFDLNKDIMTVIDESGEELNKLLVLLLGCAIQSDRKRLFVDRITKLDAKVQIGLASHIKKLTEGTSIVVSASEADRFEVFRHLERVMRERDALVEIASIDQESDEGSSTTAASSLNGDLPPKRRDFIYERRSPSPSSYERHTNVEIAEAKEEKDDEIHDLKYELEEKAELIHKLQEERLELIKDARAAKDYRDELDCVQHKITKMDKIESENAKMREKLNDLEFFKTRSEDLSKANALLDESIAELEEQISRLQSEIKAQTETEIRLEEAKTSIRSLQDVISEKNQRIEDHIEEQLRLEGELMNRNAKIAELERDSVSSTPRHALGSLAEQLGDADRQEISRLRAENRKLRAQTEGASSTTATPDTSFLVPPGEVEELRTNLEVQEQRAEEFRVEAEKLKIELKQFDSTFDRVSQELLEATRQIEVMKVERDEALHGLCDARRKFAQFQTEFGKKLEEESENKIRELEFDLKEAKRRLQQADEDRGEIEVQLERVREEQKRLRVDLDEAREQRGQQELALAHAERARRSVENERNVLRERSEKLEDELEDMRMRLLNTDDAAKRLEDREKIMVEQKNRLGDCEAEVRTLQQQLKLEQNKTQRLREDLVAEKSRGSEVVGRLRSLCAAVSLNGGKIDTEMDDVKLIDSIDDVIMTALTTARRESDALRLQQHTQIAELADLKKDIEKLRRSESASLTESDDRVRELSQENIGMKEQVFMVQEKVRELNIEIATKNSEIVSAKREIEELHRNQTSSAVSNTELARLQVSLRNLQLQEDLLKQDNNELRQKLELAEKSRVTAKKDADSLTSMHQALLADHDRLQNLHDLLTHDYENAKRENVDMKTKLRQHFRSMASPMLNNSSSRELDELRLQLAQERTSKDKQLRAYADLHNEHGATRRQLESLRSENEHLARNRDALTSELRRMRSTEPSHEWSAAMNDLNHQLQAKDLEIAKLNNKIEMLTQLNKTYDEENKNLSRQIEMLLTQNKELLNRALNDKDQYHQEQKDFQERLSALRRHKEKLEEKIMDQYRSMENKKTSDRKQPLVKRAAKALISRRRATSNGGSTTEDSSAYSADEGGSPPLFNGATDDCDGLAPTCSSSDDHDRNSPRYETIPPLQELTSTRYSAMRQRGDPIGGSVRIGTGPRRPLIHSRTYDHIILNDVNPLFDKPSSTLPPRAPVRNSSVTASLRSRPPPPPYQAKNGVVPRTPPSYQNRNPHPSPMDSPPLFQPRCSSTPKSGSPMREIEEIPRENGASAVISDRLVVPEGEQRTFIREKEERVDKAMSYYENVNNPSMLNDSTTNNGNEKANESTVWYEYGCV
ncbi:unnamed protein product [Caenorhabditis auriculariae]|uniref:HOOK N-terminal domain-containing protein n=1 Tax=Caenorhabditis auriculariae TaxID=2777116 RepID=A0A8S1HET3_9PELO|nr:unnamed protein product [Caenorhabditis auriculariae]